MTETVLIIGAGPTGLTMACELARRGIACRIIDQRVEPIKTSNALAVHARTLEVWQDMGLIEEALSEGHILHGFNIYANGKRIVRIRLNHIDSPYPFVLSLPQAKTEELLTHYLQRYDVAVERGVSLTELNQNDNVVRVTLTQTDDKTEEVETQWLIACDGGYSHVREQLGLPFEGVDLPEHFVMADLYVQSETKKSPRQSAGNSTRLNNDEINAFFSKEGPFAIIPMTAQGFSRVLAEVSSDSELSNAKSVTLKDFERLAKERCPVPLELSEPDWTSTFWTHRRISEQYRVNRVLLAGDCAHLHSPAGGQGMNTGIQDAYNLAWKLALVIENKTSERLLDSYEPERRPVAQEVLKETTWMTHLVSINMPILQRVRNTALALITQHRKIREHFAEQIAEINFDYCDSPIVQEYTEKEKTRPRFLKGPKAGQRAPDGTVFTLHNNKTTLYNVIAGTQHALLLFAGSKKALSPAQLHIFITISQWIEANHHRDIFRDITSCLF